MKSFQQIAPTIYSWLRFKRFRRIRRGWLRLLIVVYAIALLGFFIASGNCAPSYSEELENIGAAIFLLYWPVVRIWLWIYDGFQKEKKIGVVKFDASGDNKNN
ncbi:MAG: hypothetical protein ABSE97_05285 [Verrucomicrobiota bacterium]|jgi:hypothetical protein